MTQPMLWLQGHDRILFPKSDEEKELETRVRQQADLDASRTAAINPNDRPVIDHAEAPSFG